MTPEEWKHLQHGEIITYTGAPGYEIYRGTICKVIRDNPNRIGVQIIQEGEYGYKVWGGGRGGQDTNRTISFSFGLSEAFKFTKRSPPLSFEEILILKIKTIDIKWEQQQAKKGNKYALLLL